MTDICTLTLPEIQTLLDWAAAEGWNPGLIDAPAFQAADPKGFLGAFVDGEMAAGISVVAYDDHFGFLGLYICQPKFRGRGLGRAVWNAGMAYLGNRSIGLDGVREQRANYQRMGFAPAHETIRLSGVVAPAASRTCRVVALQSSRPILKLDRACFPAERQAFLTQWVAPPHSGYLALVDDEPAGYLVARPCRQNRKVGPLFARDVDIAIDLLSALKGELQIDVPASQAGFIGQLRRMGFEPSFQTTRMYRGMPPQIALDQVFGISSLELG